MEQHEERILYATDLEAAAFEKPSRVARRVEQLGKSLQGHECKNDPENAHRSIGSGQEAVFEQREAGGEARA